MDERTSGNGAVDPAIRRDAVFRHWRAAQRAAGHELLDARTVFRFGPYWGLHVRVRVASEDRVKGNELVIGRPDVSAVVLYRRTGEAGPGDTEVVLVREFRSPCTRGFVHELPGGSGAGGPVETALAEVAEETGLVLARERLREHGPRQVSAMTSAHRTHLFSAEVTAAELARLRASGPLGDAAEGERTHVEVVPLARIRREGLVDWATLGMICEVLAPE